jgi:hypothetical protein
MQVPRRHMGFQTARLIHATERFTFQWLTFASVPFALTLSHVPLTRFVQCLLVHWHTSNGGGRRDWYSDQVVGWAIRGLIFSWRKRDFTPPNYPADRICDPQSIILNWLRFSFQGVKRSRGVNLSTHLYVVARLRMSGVIPLLPLRGIMAWAWTNLPYLVFFLF